MTGMAAIAVDTSPALDGLVLSGPVPARITGPAAADRYPAAVGRTGPCGPGCCWS